MKAASWSTGAVLRDATEMVAPVKKISGRISGAAPSKADGGSAGAQPKPPRPVARSTRVQMDLEIMGLVVDIIIGIVGAIVGGFFWGSASYGPQYLQPPRRRRGLDPGARCISRRYRPAI
jgi:hypothetical protein